MRNNTIALGLGSNLGVPLQNLRRALAEIKKNHLFEVQKVSSIYESDALLPEKSGSGWDTKYLNAVVLCKISDNLAPETILVTMKQIEVIMGRAASERWAPRLIDIDILYWSGEKIDSEKLQIPHKELLVRPFALLPLLEVWPVLNLALPPWAMGFASEIPFKTEKSRRHFWPKMVGILNITADSFSDGGKFLNTDSLHAQLNRLVADGAEVIDVGAESTRPRIVTDAVTVPGEIEFKNLNWALSEIIETKTPVAISLDCRHPEVIAPILEKHNISFLNDVTGFGDGAMQKLLLQSKLPAFVMHSLGVPPSSKHVLEATQNPCTLLTQWWQVQRQKLIEFGIAPEQLIFDPGIGFGKTQLQNFYILRHLEEFSQIANPIMIGHSRKSFLKNVFRSERPAAERDLETALVTRELNLAYVQFLRVHDVETQMAALK